MSDISFKLETPAGLIQYSPSKDTNYTEFAQLAIKMFLDYGNQDIDPDFVQIIKTALDAYSNGEELDYPNQREFGPHPQRVNLSEFEYEEETSDPILNALSKIEEQDIEIEQAKDKVKTLPVADFLQMRIFYVETSNIAKIDKLLNKSVELHSDKIESLYRKAEPFVLPYSKAIELYVNLRTLGCFLDINIHRSNIEASNSNISKTKKASAARKSVNKKLDLTGNETISNEVGIIGE